MCRSTEQGEESTDARPNLRAHGRGAAREGKSEREIPSSEEEEKRRRRGG